MKSFNQWKRQEVEEHFGLEEAFSYPLLDEWLQSKYTLKPNEETQLKQLQSLLKYNVDLWNEMELKVRFLGPLLALVDYDTEHYKFFMERQLEVHKENEVATGTVDFLIAKGKQIPRSPFFSIHEYKPDSTASKDPLGQLLIALVAIQQSNKAEGYTFPLYGAYVVGRFFYFVVLNDKTYAKSDAYVATKNELFDIFSILKQVKVYINEIISKEK